MAVPTLVTFILYLICLLGIGLYFCRRNESIEDYLLGGRKMGAWVTALSTQASDMSGWLLMGLPGAIYIGGMANAWGGFGAALGPVVLFALFSSRAVLAGMVAGTVVLIAWKQFGLSETMYELVPGFFANSLTIAVANRVTQQSDATVLRQFDVAAAEMRRARAIGPATTYGSP